jgi:hypothetical protein
MDARFEIGCRNDDAKFAPQAVIGGFGDLHCSTCLCPNPTLTAQPQARCGEAVRRRDAISS